jgi:hypothetical protein
MQGCSSWDKDWSSFDPRGRMLQTTSSFGLYEKCNACYVCNNLGQTSGHTNDWWQV